MWIFLQGIHNVARGLHLDTREVKGQGTLKMYLPRIMEYNLGFWKNIWNNAGPILFVKLI